MSGWGWAVLCLCVLLILLCLLSLLRTLRSLRALKNLYLYKAFDLDLNEAAQTAPKVTFRGACKRLLHPLAICSYSDWQFDLPPALHCLLWLWYAAVELLIIWVAGINSDEEFLGNVAVAASVIGTTVGVAGVVGMEAVFIRGINAKNRGRTSTEYHISQEPETRTVNTLPLDLDIPIALDRTIEEDSHHVVSSSKGELTFRNVTEPPQGEGRKENSNVAVEVVLMVVAMVTTAAALCDAYLVSEQIFPNYVYYWLFAVAADVPLRVLISALLALVGGLPNHQRRFKRLDYNLTSRNLLRFLNPSIAEPTCQPLFGTNEAGEPGPLTNFSEDTLRQHWSEVRRAPAAETCTQGDERRESTRRKNTENSARSQYDDDLDGPSQSLESLESPQLTPMGAMTAQAVIPRSAGSSNPATDRDPTFPPQIPLVRISAIIDPAPTAAVFPQDSPKPALVEEFPIPPLVDRFSDIEGSPRDSEPPTPAVITVTHVVSPKRKKEGRPPLRKFGEMSESIFGHRPGLFGKGQLKSVRSSRSLQPQKRKAGRSMRPQLEAIISENEEDFEWNSAQEINRSQSLAALRSTRCASPEAAESTRYQTPNSPKIIVRKADLRQFLEPIKVEDTRFEQGTPLPPVQVEEDVFLRPRSPTAAEDSRVSFIGSEVTSSRDTRRHVLYPSHRTLDSTVSERRIILAQIAKDGALGRRQRLGQEVTEARPRLRRQSSDLESPYQEILWRRIRDDDSQTSTQAARSQMRDGYAASKLRALIDTYKEGNSRPKSTLTRHRSLAPLSRGGDRSHGFRTVSRASLLDRGAQD